MWFNFLLGWFRVDSGLGQWFIAGWLKVGVRFFENSEFAKGSFVFR
jgi:hypothetical protein